MKKSNATVRRALRTLTNEEKELFSLLLLTDADAETDKRDVISFLARYPIDDEPAAVSFLLNDPADRFGIGEADSPLIPRIRGLKEFFRFHNVTVMARIPTDEVITDPDLFMKIRYPDEIRPITAADPFLSRNELTRLLGKRYTQRIVASAVPVTVRNKTYLIPDDRYLADMICLGSYLSAGKNGRGVSVLLRSRYSANDGRYRYLRGSRSV